MAVLPARQEGTGERRYIYVDVDDLRQFAALYGYRFDEAFTQEYAKWFTGDSPIRQDR